MIFLHFQEAIVLLRKTLEYKSETYGEFSNEVADTHKLIGNVHLANGDAEKALKSLRKVKILALPYSDKIIHYQNRNMLKFGFFAKISDVLGKTCHSTNNSSTFEVNELSSLEMHQVVSA